MIRLEFACRDKSCAPPPVGTGGSNPSGAGRAATALEALRMSKESRDALRDRVLDEYPSLFRNQMPDGLYDDYAAANQLIAYTGIEYQTINRYLRDDDDYANSEKVQLMDRAFRNHSVELTEPVTVYRGMRMEHHKDNPYEPEAGYTLEDKAFMSTSARLWEAFQFAGGKSSDMTSGMTSTSVVVQIKVPAGTRVLGGEMDEKELILNRGTKVRVTGVRKVVLNEQGKWDDWVEGDYRNRPTTLVDAEVIE